MSLAAVTPAALKTRFLQLDLRDMIATTLIAGILLFATALGSASYLVIRQHIAESAQELIDARARMQRGELELRFGTALAEAAAFAGGSAAALNDAAGRDTQFALLLRDFRLSWPGATLSVADRRGTTLSGRTLDAESKQILLSMFNTGTAYAGLRHAESGNAAIEVALPLRQRQRESDAPQGAILLRLPLDTLALQSGDGDWELHERSGRRLAGRMPPEGALQSRAALKLPQGFEALGLGHALSVDKSSALESLDALAFAYFAACALLILVAVRISYRMADLIAAPLRELTTTTERIAATGRPSAWVKLESAREFQRIAAAFNKMIDRLAETYTALESRVEIRTRELQSAKTAAEKAGQLLKEAVQCVAVGFVIYDENDRLVQYNDAYVHYYKRSRKAILPGATFEEILRYGVEHDQYANPLARENPEEFLRERIARHRKAEGHPSEQQLGDGRWLQVVEHRTPSGHIVGSRIDITGLKLMTEALHQRELHLRATLDNLPFLFWLKDTNGAYLAVNRAFAKACGRESPEALKGLSDVDVWPEDLAHAYRADDRAIMDSRSEKSTEQRAERDGELRWFETFKRPVIAEDGSVLGTVGFSRDITERKYVERALRDSEARWQLAMAGANDGIWDWDLRSGKVYFSERWKSMLGHAPEEIGNDIGEWRSRLHPDDRDWVIADAGDHLTRRTDFYQAEYRMRCKDGSYKWILARGRASFDESGEPVRVVGSATDMTERRRSEEAVLDHAVQLDAIFQLSPDGFLSFDAAHRVRYACPAFYQITGLEPEQTLGTDEVEFSAMLAARCVPAAMFRGVAALRDAGAESSAAHQLIELALPRGRTLDIRLRKSQAPNVSQILHVRDVTREIELDRMKSEFLSMAAHELRTPMASIYGFSELLLTQSFNADTQRDLVDTIHRNAELISSIINELLDLARIEARRGMDFAIEAIPAQQLVERIVGNFKVPEGRDAPDMDLSAATLWLRADPKKLEQAVANVLSNAYKYSPGGGSVQLALLQADAPGAARKIGLRISDQGIGLTPGQLARVCERFYRADTSGKIPGTGLGMSIVKEIVELHDGSVEIASEAGTGTQITLWIPAVPAPAAGADQGA